MCNCIAELRDKAKEYLIAHEKVNPDTIKEVYFANQSIVFSGNKGLSVIGAPITIKTVSEKGKKGTRTFNFTPKYCPFCGKQYEE